MNARSKITMAFAISLLGACFSSYDRQDDATLHHSAQPDDAAVDSAKGDRGADAGHVDSGGVALAAASPQTQIWLGAVHHPNRALVGCGPHDPDQTQQRALLLLDLDALGQVHAASLTLGEGPALPPVEDKDAYYPPDPPWDWHGCPMRGLVPGFEYPIYDARLTSERLTASIHPADVVKEWCELQPSYRASPPAAEAWGEYLCRPTDAFQDPSELSYAIPDPSRGTSELPPFVPEELCFQINAPCVCDQDSCTASPYGGFQLDVQLTDDLLSGRFAFMDIKLERQR